jgi:hypothetical protein
MTILRLDNVGIVVEDDAIGESLFDRIKQLDRGKVRVVFEFFYRRLRAGDCSGREGHCQTDRQRYRCETPRFHVHGLAPDRVTDYRQARWKVGQTTNRVK